MKKKKIIADLIFVAGGLALLLLVLGAIRQYAPEEAEGSSWGAAPPAPIAYPDVEFIDDLVGASDTAGAGTGGATNPIASEANRIGLARSNTAATIGNNRTLYWGGFGLGALVPPAHNFDLTLVVRLNTNDANTVQRIGFTGNVVTNNPPADGIYFEKLDTDTSWFCVARAASVQTRTAAILATDTAFHRFRIRRVDAATIGCSIDGGTEFTLTTNLPTVVLFPETNIATTAAADKTHDIDFMRLRITGLTR